MVNSISPINAIHKICSFFFLNTANYNFSFPDVKHDIYAMKS